MPTSASIVHLAGLASDSRSDLQQCTTGIVRKRTRTHAFLRWHVPLSRRADYAVTPVISPPDCL
jgi:hypothetical protein